MSEELRKRNDTIIWLRDNGMAYTKIAKAYGISAPRARAIYEREQRRLRGS